MASFSSASLHAIETFASRIGISAIPASDGTFSFRLEQSGDLSFMPSVDGKRLIISLVKMQAYSDSMREFRALSMAGVDPVTGFNLYAGMTINGAIVLSFALNDDEIDTPTVERCIEYLISAHAKV